MEGAWLYLLVRVPTMVVYLARFKKIKKLWMYKYHALHVVYSYRMYADCVWTMIQEIILLQSSNNNNNISRVQDAAHRDTIATIQISW